MYTEEASRLQELLRARTIKARRLRVEAQAYVEGDRQLKAACTALGQTAPTDPEVDLRFVDTKGGHLIVEVKRVRSE